MQALGNIGGECERGSYVHVSPRGVITSVQKQPVGPDGDKENANHVYYAHVADRLVPAFCYVVATSLQLSVCRQSGHSRYLLMLQHCSHSAINIAGFPTEQIVLRQQHNIQRETVTKNEFTHAQKNSRFLLHVFLSPALQLATRRFCLPCILILAHIQQEKLPFYGWHRNKCYMQNHNYNSKA